MLDLSLSWNCTASVLPLDVPADSESMRQCSLRKHSVHSAPSYPNLLVPLRSLICITMAKFETSQLSQSSFKVKNAFIVGWFCCFCSCSIYVAFAQFPLDKETCLVPFSVSQGKPNI